LQRVYPSTTSIGYSVMNLRLGANQVYGRRLIEFYIANLTSSSPRPKLILNRRPRLALPKSEGMAATDSTSNTAITATWWWNNFRVRRVLTYGKTIRLTLPEK
jgi:hypothetical protein